MDINLNKTDVYSYYYSIDGKQFGPFNLDQLIPNIDGNTLVWREGIEWTNANRLEELKKYFPDAIVIEKPISLNSNSNQYVSIKKSMFNASFSFDGRIRRTEYCLSLIIYGILYAIVLGLVKSSAVFGLAYIPLLWFLWAQGAKRCHDRGNSGWYQIIPFYALWMMFAEGDLSVNEYGNSPK